MNFINFFDSNISDRATKPILNALVKCISIVFLIISLTSHLKRSVLISIVLIIFFCVIFVIRKNYLISLLKIKKAYYYLAGLSAIGIAVQFKSNIPQTFALIRKAKEVLGNNYDAIENMLCLFLGLVIVPAISLLLYALFEKVFETSIDTIKINKKFIKPFFVLFFIYLASIFTIIRANYNYIDDFGRAYSGYKGWGYFSRFISNFLANYIHGNSYLGDCSPIPQIIAVAFLAIASLIVLKVLTGKENFNFFEYCAIIPLGISPYFLECVSYKFDAPYMALSILASVFPILFISKENRRRKLIVATIIGTLVVCMTYQAALGIFPIIIIFICLLDYLFKRKECKEILNVLAESVIGYFVGIIIFKIYIMRPASDYISSTLPSIKEFFPTLISNYSKYFGYVVSDFNPLWLITIALLIIGFIVMVIKSSEMKVKALGLSILALILTLLLSFGLYPALVLPIFYPRAMYGLGAWISFMTLSAISLISVDKKVCVYKILVVAISWMFFTFSFTYGNSLSVQEDYEFFKISEIVYDIEKIYPDSNSIELQIIGSVGHATGLDNAIKTFPILDRLIPINLREGWMWSEHKLCLYYDTNLVLHSLEDDLTKLNMPIISETQSYILRGNGEFITIEFK